MSDEDDFVVTSRSVEGRPGELGDWIVSVTGYDHRDEAGTDYWVPKRSLGQYAFVPADEDMADVIRGDLPDVDGTAVICVGSNLAKHYWSSTDDPVPVDVLEWLDDRDMILVRGADGGWASWDGRPEFSTSYIDFTDADVLDMTEEIAARREADEI